MSKGGISILVVDDEPAIGLVCQRTLAEEGFIVDTASSGDEAQGLLKAKDYDLILLDIKMPGMSGRAFLDYIGSHYGRLVSRTVMTSGDLVGMDAYEFPGLGERHFLAKPFTPDELKATVKESLGMASRDGPAHKHTAR